MHDLVPVFSRSARCLMVPSNLLQV